MVHGQPPFSFSYMFNFLLFPCSHVLSCPTKLSLCQCGSSSAGPDLGLIDEIGDAHQILKEKFGEDVVIKKFEKTKSWLSKKLSASNDHIDQFAYILEEKSIWQKYGL